MHSTSPISFTSRRDNLSSSSSPRGETPKNHSKETYKKVNEEYMKTLRSKSYLDIWTSVHDQSQPAGEAVSCSNHSRLRLSESHLQPHQDILIDMIDRSQLHVLVLDYFNGSLEAFRICNLLLEKITQARANYSIIQKILLQKEMLIGVGTDDECTELLTDLSSFANLENPFSGLREMQFDKVQDLCSSMIEELKITSKNIITKAKLVKLVKRGAGLCLIIAAGAVVVAGALLVIHAAVGTAAMPLICITNCDRVRHTSGKWFHEKRYFRLGAQLDAAAKGAYTLGRDFDTVRTLVTKIYDHLEHIRAVIDICLRNPKRDLIKEAIKEFESSESSFVKQLGELEDHIYLCFLTIDRARGLVLRETSLQQRN